MGNTLNKSNVILAGDFNAPNINWENNEVNENTTISERQHEVLNEHGLNQLVREPTRRQGDSQSILDLVLTTGNNTNMVNTINIVPGISDHDIVAFSLNVSCQNKRWVKRKIYIRNRADTNRVKEELRKFSNHFENSLKQESTDVKWDEFEKTVRHIMDDCIPNKLTSSRYNLPWFSQSLRRLSKSKK